MSNHSSTHCSSSAGVLSASFSSKHRNSCWSRIFVRVQRTRESVHFPHASTWNVNFRPQIDFSKKPMSAASVHLLIQPTSMSTDAHYLRTHRGIGLDIALSIYVKTVIDSVIKNPEWSLVLVCDRCTVLYSIAIVYIGTVRGALYSPTHRTATGEPATTGNFNVSVPSLIAGCPGSCTLNSSCGYYVYNVQSTCTLHIDYAPYSTR